ncbi:MAG: radical SAM protein [Clostridia bacterium]|nr:radical SAM protein [Clostridia bacterium]
MEEQRELNALTLLDAMKEKGVSPDERYRRLNRYLEANARRNGIPLHGSLELTSFCNLDCKMCYVHPEKGMRAEAPLSPETWIRLIDEAREMGLLRVSLTGGECLTYPGFDDVYLHLYERGMKIRILTNGLLLDEKRIAFFRRYRPTSFQITLYGGDEAEYEAVTGHRVFGKMMDHLAMLKEAELPVSLSITPNPFMRQDVRPLLEAAARTGFPWQINSFLMPPRAETGRSGGDLPSDRYIEILRTATALRGEELTPADPAAVPPPSAAAAEPVRGTSCGAGRSSFAILHNGIMCPCVGLPDIRTEPLTVGFREAWNTLHEAAVNLPAPGECRGCAYEAQCTLCPANHRSAAPGHCDRRICDRTLKMVSAGLMRLPDIKNPCE